jgi:hypothetical protein
MLLIFWLLSSTGLPIDFVYDHVQHHNFKWLVLVSQFHAYLFSGIWRRPRPNHEPIRDRDSELFGSIVFRVVKTTRRFHAVMSPLAHVPFEQRQFITGGGHLLRYWGAGQRKMAGYGEVGNAARHFVKSILLAGSWKE